MSETILTRISAVESRLGEKPFLFLIKGDGSSTEYSYRQLLERARRWTHYYNEKGVAPGDRVIVSVPHSLDLYASYIGAFFLGAIPAMFAHPSQKYTVEAYLETTEHLIGISSPKVFVTYAEVVPKLKKLSLSGVDIVCVEDVSLPESSSELQCDVDSGSTAFIQFSSGTTGLKKGVEISHSALLWQIDTYAEMIKLGAEDVIVSWLPLYHDMGLISCFFMPLLTGAPLVCMSPFDWVRRPGMLLQAVSEHKGTLVWTPNFSFNFMARNVSQEDLMDVDLSSLRGIVNCSEPIQWHSQEAFVKRFSAFGFKAEALASSYAMAENTFAVTSGGFGRPCSRIGVNGEVLATTSTISLAIPEEKTFRYIPSSGFPLRQTEIKVRSPEGKELSDCEVGEIYIKSPCLFNGYLGNDEATQKALFDGWYRTGDQGFFHEGELYVIGRLEDLIIIAGVNVFPQDIEDIVNQVPGVHPGRCVAFSVENEEEGTARLVILAETKEEDMKVRNRIRAEVFKVITQKTEVAVSEVDILSHGTLFKSSAGKVSRKLNKKEYMKHLEQKKNNTVEADAKATGAVGGCSTLQAVRRCLAQVVSGRISCDIGDISDDDQIRDMGYLDSFGSMELILKLESEFGISLSDAMVLDRNWFSSIASIARMVDDLQNGTGGVKERPVGLTPESICMTLDPENLQAPRTRHFNFWTLYYSALFTAYGIKFGKGLHVFGPLVLQIDGSAKNIEIGDNVTFMPHVHLKVRENGRIRLNDGVKLDTGVRIVAAREALVELGANVCVGLYTQITGGKDVLVGRNTMTASHVLLMASEHCAKPGTPIRQQGFEHEPIYVGEDVWLGNNVFVEKGSSIGNNCIVGVNSVVAGTIPDSSIAMGFPAKVIGSRA